MRKNSVIVEKKLVPLIKIENQYSGRRRGISQDKQKHKELKAKQRSLSIYKSVGDKNLLKSNVGKKSNLKLLIKDKLQEFMELIKEEKSETQLQ